MEKPITTRGRQIAGEFLIDLKWKQNASQVNWPRQTDRKNTVCHGDLVTDFVTVILSQSEGLGKMALGIVKQAYNGSSQPIGVIWFTVSLFAVSLSLSVVVDPQKWTLHMFLKIKFRIEGLCLIFPYGIIFLNALKVLKPRDKLQTNNTLVGKSKI